MSGRPWWSLAILALPVTGRAETCDLYQKWIKDDTGGATPCSSTTTPTDLVLTGGGGNLESVPVPLCIDGSDTCAEPEVLCADGTNAFFHVDAGTGDGVNRWVFVFTGGPVCP